MKFEGCVIGLIEVNAHRDSVRSYPRLTQFDNGECRSIDIDTA